MIALAILLLTGGAPPADSVSNIFLVTGNSAVIHYTPPAWWEEKKPIRAEFAIRSRGPFDKPVLITSSGLGPVTFSAAGNRSTDVTAVLLPKISPEPVIVRMVILPAQLNHRGDCIEGKIQITASGAKDVTVPMKIVVPDAGPFLTALSWFFGIAIPGFIGALIAYWSNIFKTKYESRQKEINTLEAFKKIKAADLQYLFTNILPAFKEEYKEKDREFTSELNKQLFERDIYTFLSNEKTTKLQAAAANADRKEMLALLAQYFEERRDEILKGEV